MLRSAPGRWVYLRAYWTYKSLWEADVEYLRRFVAPSSWIVDVGANVGFFTHRFCGWVKDGGRVLAFEPEEENYLALQDMSRRLGHEGVLLARRSLLADRDAMLHLELNPDNPADHRIGDSGVPTPATRLDTMMRELGWPPVGLIKIDVQGAECMVLEGARETLARSQPALFIEVDDRALRRFGATARSLQLLLRTAGYQMFQARALGLEKPIDSSDAQTIIAKLGYADFVFLPKSGATTR